MGHDKVRRIQPMPPVCQNVQVQCAWAVASGPAPSAKPGFDGLEGSQQSMRGPAWPKRQGNDLIQIKRLLGIAPGFGFIAGACRRKQKIREGDQTVPGRGQGGFPVAQIGTKGDVGCYKWAMRGDTSSRTARQSLSLVQTKGLLSWRPPHPARDRSRPVMNRKSPCQGWRSQLSGPRPVVRRACRRLRPVKIMAGCRETQL